MNRSMLTKTEIERLAELAMLDTRDPGFEGLAGDVARLAEFLAPLTALREDCAEGRDDEANNVLRPDTVRRNHDREELLQNAPAGEAGGFFAPRVAE